MSPKKPIDWRSLVSKEMSAAKKAGKHPKEGMSVAATRWKKIKSGSDPEYVVGKSTPKKSPKKHSAKSHKKHSRKSTLSGGAGEGMLNTMKTALGIKSAAAEEPETPAEAESDAGNTTTKDTCKKEKEAVESAGFH